MKTVKLKRLELINFKGIKEMSIDFSDGTTEIQGDNATGKTTIQDAFTWCLFGKDSQDRTDSGRGAFMVKTVDENGEPILHLDHAVTAILEVDGRQINFTRRIKENWTRPKQEEETVLKGNDTIYLIDGVEVKAKDYNQQINDIIDEETFKLITNPAHFPSLHWEKQRDTLITIAGGITIESVAQRKEEWRALIREINGSDIQAHRESIAYRKKKIKEERATTDPTIKGIDSVTPSAPDYEALEKEKKQYQDELDQLELIITDRAKADQLANEREREKRNKISELRAKKDAAYYEHSSRLRKQHQEEKQKQESQLEELKAAINKAATSVRIKDEQVATIEGEVRRSTNKVKELTERLEKKREEWKKRNAETYKENNDEQFICPVYKIVCSDTKANMLNREEKEAARNAFIKLQNEDLDRINREGIELSSQLNKEKEHLKRWEIDMMTALQEQEWYHNEYDKAKDALQKVQSNLPEIPQPDILSDPLYKKEVEKIDKQIEELTAELKEHTEHDEKQTEEIRTKRNTLIEKITDINSRLNIRLEIEKNQAEIKKVLDRDAELAQQEAELEKKDFIAKSLHDTYITEVEQRVNSLFKLVRFKMFESQINGNQVPTCTAMINGVKYSDLNSAAKINAGLDIINTLQKYNNITAPIFIDNAESINDLYPIKGQKILLRVTRDPKLKVVREEDLEFMSNKIMRETQRVYK